MKHGVGRWIQILELGLLPGKLIQQLNGQTQRLLGQQSLAAYTGLQVDIDRIRADNDKLVDAERKNGLVINSGRELWRGWHGGGRGPAVGPALCCFNQLRLFTVPLLFASALQPTSPSSRSSRCRRKPRPSEGAAGGSACYPPVSIEHSTGGSRPMHNFKGLLARPAAGTMQWPAHLPGPCLPCPPGPQVWPV